MASRKLEDLLPAVQKKAEDFLAECGKRGVDVLIYCTYRSDAEQAALYAQGREDLETVNSLRAATGLYLLCDAENRIVTYAKPGESGHNKRTAFDCVPLEGGKPVWDADNPLWQKIGEIAESTGLKWAGRWTRFREYPHMYEDA
jgi:peptidoglycan L-alanyl-D-glutamate endopeptidase CwlK